MKLIGIITITLAALFGCKKQSMDTVTISQPAAADTAKAAPPVTNNGQFTYLALGDSYTIGEAVPIDQAYPNQLASQLRLKGLKVDVPMIIARTGWTTANLKQAIADAHLTQKFSFVTLLIGVNNQYQHLDPEVYRTEFRDLLDAAINFANGDKTKVFVISIPDYSVTAFASAMDTYQISLDIDKFNAINESESAVHNVNYINITTESRNAKTDPTLIASDGLHPSGKMYMQWVTQLLPEVMKALK